MSDFTPSFFIVPARIINLPGMTLSYLKFYETIFQFWNHDKLCYLSNDKIKERTGIKSDSTIKECFSYFEKHNELKRIVKGKRRYIVQPTMKIEHVDKSDDGLATARGGSRSTETKGLAPARHNNNNINNKEIKREPARKKHVPLPDNFMFDEKTIKCWYETAIKVGISVDDLMDKFVDVCKKYGTKAEDWNATFRLFLKKERPEVIKPRPTKVESTHARIPFFDKEEEANYQRQRSMTHAEPSRHQFNASEYGRTSMQSIKNIIA